MTSAFEDTQPALVPVAAARRRPGARMPLLLASTAGIAAAIGAIGTMLAIAPSEVETFKMAELLAPKVAAAPPKIAPDLRSAAIDWSIVTNGPGGQFLVLAPLAPSEWAAAGGEFTHLDTFTSVARPAASSLQLMQASVAGRELELFDREKIVCRAITGDLLLLGGAYIDGAPADLEEAQGQVGQLGLVTRLIPVRGDCSGAVWGREALLAEVEISKAHEVQAALRTRARAAFAKLPAYRDIQKQFRKEVSAGEWIGTAGTTMSLFLGAQETLLVVQAAVGGCGEFEASLRAVYRVGENSLELVQVANDPNRVMAAADIDGDGHLDLFTNEQAILRSTDKYEPSLIFSFPSRICPC